jgi:hypothetical protein
MICRWPFDEGPCHQAALDERGGRTDDFPTDPVAAVLAGGRGARGAFRDVFKSTRQPHRGGLNLYLSAPCLDREAETCCHGCWPRTPRGDLASLQSEELESAVASRTASARPSASSWSGQTSTPCRHSPCCASVPDSNVGGRRAAQVIETRG